MLGSGNNRTVNAAGVCAHEDRRNDCNSDWSLHLVRKRLHFFPTFPMLGWGIMFVGGLIMKSGKATAS